MVGKYVMLQKSHVGYVDILVVAGYPQIKKKKVLYIHGGLTERFLMSAISHWDVELLRLTLGSPHIL